MNLYFAKWLEYVALGGLEPSKESPIDMSPSVGQTNAMPTYCLPGSKELPPVKKIKRMKKK